MEQRWLTCQNVLLMSLGSTCASCVMRHVHHAHNKDREHLLASKSDATAVGQLRQQPSVVECSAANLLIA